MAILRLAEPRKVQLKVTLQDWPWWCYISEAIVRSMQLCKSMQLESKYYCSLSIKVIIVSGLKSFERLILDCDLCFFLLKRLFSKTWFHSLTIQFYTACWPIKGFFNKYFLEGIALTRMASRICLNLHPCACKLLSIKIYRTSLEWCLTRFVTNQV